MWLLALFFVAGYATCYILTLVNEKVNSADNGLSSDNRFGLLKNKLKDNWSDLGIPELLDLYSNMKEEPLTGIDYWEARFRAIKLIALEELIYEKARQEAG